MRASGDATEQRSWMGSPVGQVTFCDYPSSFRWRVVTVPPCQTILTVAAPTDERAFLPGSRCFQNQSIDGRCLDRLCTLGDHAAIAELDFPVMDLGEWLRRLDLEQYEPVFRENKIDDAVLPNLTAEDLKDLGIEFVGHRRKLLDAIAALRTEAPTPLSDAPVAIEKAGSDTAERRQVTVMFSDLVGSTALSASMDPEDLRELIMAYQTCVADTVRRFGGFVAKYMGDGVLVYFGYPQAHEHDAERAVRAGLELVSAVSNLKTHAALQTRVGIATGLVVVGDLIGAGASQEQAIVGETPNLAARLQGIAEPNSIVIADGTRQLVGDLFELEDLGRQELKGISAPVRAWAARRPASVEGRFEAMHANGLTDLVGREEELNLLLRRWSKAKSGEGQGVLLSGEGGIGKTPFTGEGVWGVGTQA